MKFSLMRWLLGVTVITACCARSSAQSAFQIDSLSLVAIYNATGGAGWTNKTNWLVPGSQVANWHGVTVQSGRVTHLSLPGNNLVGGLPIDIGNLNALQELQLSSNKITSVPESIKGAVFLQELFISYNELTDFPDLSTMPLLTDIALGGNFLTFEDLVPNVGIPGNYLYYMWGQKNLPVGGKISITTGNSLNLSVTVGGTGNLYQWWRNNVMIPGATASAYAVAQTSIDHAGNYHLAVTNPAMPNVVLITNNFEVEILTTETGANGYKFSKKLGAEALNIPVYNPENYIAVDAGGNYYLRDAADNNYIRKLDPSGNLVQSFNVGADFGSCQAGFSVDDNGSVFVVTECSDKLIKYNLSGSKVFTKENVTTGYGTLSGNGFAHTCTIDAAGNVVVVPRYATGGFFINRFHGDTGDFIEQIPLVGSPHAASPSSFLLLDIAVDAAGNIYIPFSYTHIEKFSPTGTYLSSFDLTSSGITGWGGMRFEIAGSGHVYAGAWSSPVYHFDETGTYLNKIGSDFSFSDFDISPAGEIVVGNRAFGLIRFEADGDFVGLVESRDADGQFNNPTGITHDSKGNRYISDYYNHRVQKFDHEGEFEAVIGAPGAGAGQFNFPTAVATDTDDNLYVVDKGNNRIQKWSPAGAHLLSIGSTGSASGQFLGPVSVAVSPTDEVYVADADNYRIQKFSAAGAYLTSFGSQGTASAQFSNVRAVAVENDGNLLVLDYYTVKRFTPQGVFINKMDLLGYGYPHALATDQAGYFYVTTASGFRKFDKQGGLVTAAGSKGKGNGQFELANAISANTAGDTVWVADNYHNRVSIFYNDERTADSLALVALYHATNGANWAIKNNWLTGNLHTWYAVAMSGNRVTELQLLKNQLKGYIPPQIANLTELTELSMSGNQLSGTIPADFWTMPALKRAYLDQNQLSGSIPASIGLSQFTHLTLSANQFTGNLPAEIGNSKLAFFYIGANQLSGSIPAEIGSITTLQGFGISQNQFSGSIPASIGNLTNLEQLSLDRNQLSGPIPDGIGNLTLLYTLILEQNQLSGPIPASIGNLTNLTFLSLRSNQLTGSIPASIGNMTSLTSALLNNNQLSGAIPAEMGNLTSLHTLYIANNQLTGAIPAEIGNMASLKELHLSNNQLTGAIPSTIGNTVLTHLYLDRNQLTGSVPAEMGDLTSLQYLDLGTNQLSGDIPATLNQCTGLKVLNFFDNQLTGLPNLSSLNSLLSFHAMNNFFTFEDIEPNLGRNGFNYSPQKKLPSPGNVTLPVGAAMNLSFAVGGTSNQYQWAKDQQNIAGATAQSFQLPAVAVSDRGSYALTITSSLVPNLVLTTETIYVSVTLAAPLATAATDITPTTFMANWEASPGAAYYSIAISRDDFVTSGGLTSTTTSVKFIGLTPNKPFKYKVWAVNDGVVSEASNAIEVTTLPVPAPVATDATGVASSRFYAQWNAVEGNGSNVSYQLDVSSDNFDSFVAGYESVAVYGTNLVVEGLLSRTTYQYRLRAVIEDVVSENSNVVTVQTSGGFGQTITFTPIADKEIGGAPFELNAFSSSGLGVSFSTTDTEVTLNGSSVALLSAGRASITASQGGGVGYDPAPPVTQSFCIKPARPSVTMAQQSGEATLLTSSAATGNQWFKNGTEIAGATNTTFTATELGNYSVVSRVEDCASDFSTSIAVVTTRIKNRSEDRFDVYPNPVQRRLFIRLPAMVPGGRVEIFGADGRLMSETEIHEAQAEIDVSGFAPSIYLVKVSSGGRIFTARVVKD